jgi:hypothetical protein
MRNKTDRFTLKPDETAIINRAIEKLLSNIEIPNREYTRIANREARRILLPAIKTKRELDLINQNLRIAKPKKKQDVIEELTKRSILLDRKLQHEQNIANGEMTIVRHQISDAIKKNLKPDDIGVRTREEARKRSSRGIAWFEDKIKRYIKNDNTHNISNYQAVQLPRIGGVYTLIYDAKHKATLPYWDQFPLIIPFSIKGDRMTCINLHYLPIDLRVKLLKKLMEYTIKYKGRERMNISYTLLKSIAELNLVKPTIHTYLFDHMKTRLIKANYDVWGIIAYLPYQKFVGASSAKVWSDSKRIINGGKR